MSKRQNPIIEKAIQDNRVRSYEVAMLLGISSSSYDRMMRKELSEDEQHRIAKIIRDYALRGYTK